MKDPVNFINETYYWSLFTFCHYVVIMLVDITFLPLWITLETNLWHAYAKGLFGECRSNLIFLSIYSTVSFGAWRNDSERQCSFGARRFRKVGDSLGLRSITLHRSYPRNFPNNNTVFSWNIYADIPQTQRNINLRVALFVGPSHQRENQTFSRSHEANRHRWVRHDDTCTVRSRSLSWLFTLMSHLQVR